MRWTTFLILISFIGLCGCEKKNETTLPPLTIITSPDNPPFEFKDTAQGGDHVIGFDMDLAQKLGEHLGRPIKIIETDFAGIIPALQAGRADMAIAALGATEERRKSVDFSDPYHREMFALLVKEDSPLHSEKDLHNKKLGAQLGSNPETIAHKWQQTIEGLEVVSLNKIGDLVQELKNNRIQAVLVDDAVAHRIAASTPALKVVILDMPAGISSIAFPKGSPLVSPVNQALKAMKKDIEQMATKWFNP